MSTYGFLLLPAANQVYNESSSQLSMGELGVFNECVLGGQLDDIEERTIGGVPYICFSAPLGLDERMVAHLSNLSSMYALFECLPDGHLRPLLLRSLDLYDSDLITIPKYRGKTNELFTKLLLNVTVASSHFRDEMLSRELFVLDPLVGRGTTLNQCLMYGWSAAGIDVDKKDLSAYQQFLRTYLKRKRLKHKFATTALRDGKKVVGERMDVEIGPTKSAFKAGETAKITTISADTTEARRYFKAGTFHALVADLPYGVRHGTTIKEGEDALARRPLALLEAVLPTWVSLLKEGGTLGIGWNRHVAGREKVTELITFNGLEVLSTPPYQSFRHFVDQSIMRDILVARKG